MYGKSHSLTVEQTSRQMSRFRRGQCWVGVILEEAMNSFEAEMADKSHVREKDGAALLYSRVRCEDFAQNVHG